VTNEMAGFGGLNLFIIFRLLSEQKIKCIIGFGRSEVFFFFFFFFF